AARPGGCVELRQPEAALAVLVGQTLTLRCTVAGDALAGAVKWLKASGGRNRTIYDQRSPQPRVARAASGSNTDFTIHIRDARPDDAGTYYCVKLRADKEDEVSRSGGGTTVSVHERSPFPSVAVAAAAATLSLLLLIFLVALCVYRRHRAGERGRAGSGCRGAPVPLTLLSSALQVAAAPGWSPWRVLRVPRAALPLQGGDPADMDIHYADLQPLPAAPRRAPCTAASEYACIPGAAR
ncbi:SHPS1 phosphatase, partial [Nothoprocta pentlandii]|nr:SHPS1 phosphatase [Nothoprocta pentlandii]